MTKVKYYKKTDSKAPDKATGEFSGVAYNDLFIAVLQYNKFRKMQILRNLGMYAELSQNGSDLCNIVNMITTCHDKQLADSLLSTLKEYQSLIIAMNNQQLTKKMAGRTWWLT